MIPLAHENALSVVDVPHTGSFPREKGNIRIPDIVRHSKWDPIKLAF